VEELDREVPRRLASFDDQLTTCGHRRGFFRRQVEIINFNDYPLASRRTPGE
jgi:hypothetical protein